MLSYVHELSYKPMICSSINSPLKLCLLTGMAFAIDIKAWVVVHLENKPWANYPCMPQKCCASGLVLIILQCCMIRLGLKLISFGRNLVLCLPYSSELEPRKWVVEDTGLPHNHMSLVNSSRVKRQVHEWSHSRDI